MRTTQHQAEIIVTVVTHYPQLVTPTMHAGIDLARALASGDAAVTEDAVLSATIADTYQQLGEAALDHFVDYFRHDA